jgi:hypothetical protein
MWVEVCVGMSEAIDLANQNPEAAKGGGTLTDVLAAGFVLQQFIFYLQIHFL